MYTNTYIHTYIIQAPMKTQDTIDNIAIASSLRGNISDQQVVNEINTYLTVDLMSDLVPFNLRNAVTFSSVGKWSDCYIPDNTKIRSVSAIKAKISQLKYPLASYTNRRIYAPMSDKVRQTPTMFNLHATERESDYFSSGIIRRVAEGRINNTTPYTLNESQLNELSNYWTKVRILNGDRQIASMTFSKIKRAGFREDGEFSCAIDYMDRSLTLQYNSIDPEEYVVKIESFTSAFSLLIDENTMFGARGYTKYNERAYELFVDCYEYPALLADNEDIIDPKLNKINKIIVMGVAKNICSLYQSSMLQESIEKTYRNLLGAYRNTQSEKDMLEFVRDRRIFDPLSIGSGYGNMGMYRGSTGWLI